MPPTPPPPRAAGRSTLLASRFAPIALALLTAHTATAQRLRVYVLAGQSNMEGHAKVATFDHLADDPATVPLLASMRGADGAPVVRDDVWIAYRTGADGAEATGALTAGFGARRDPQRSDDKIGPEFTFGIRMGQVHDDPVLLIKCAWGGKSLHTDFRPPSAGPYEFSPQQLERLQKQQKDIDAAQREKQQATGHHYRETIAYVRKVLADLPHYCPRYDASAGHELAGFVWFQGWNDMVDGDVYPDRGREGGYAQYTTCLQHLIRDVRKDLGAPELPFVIGVMGVGGELEPGKDSAQRNFRAAMAAAADPAEVGDRVHVVPTAPFWDEALGRIDDKLAQVRQHEHLLRTKNPRSANADGSMDEQAQREHTAAFRKQLISEAEETMWARGASNGGYHYLGCAKTMARIGVAFADALLPGEAR